MSNNDIMEILLKNDNLSELTYDNNILTYQGKSIDISNVNLNDFFSSSYSQMYLDQKTISAEDFYNIMDIHSKKIEKDFKPNIENQSEDDLQKMALNYLSNLGGKVK